ncbi:MAG: HD domain-containing phosphohydrolase [Deltaproteobacteria bacterium]
MGLSLKSVEDVSVIRKFRIFYILLAAIPFAILATLFIIFYLSDDIRDNSTLLFWAFVIVGMFMAITFFALRHTLSRLQSVTKDVSAALSGGRPQRIDLKSSGDNEIAQIARSFNDVVKRLEETIGELERSKNMLQDILTKVASGVSFTENINAFLDLIMKTTVGAVDAKYGLLLIRDEQQGSLQVRSSWGFSDAGMKTKRIADTLGAVEWPLRQKQPLLVPSLQRGQVERFEEGFEPPLMSVPLIYQNDVIGVLVLSGKVLGENFTQDDMLIVSNIAAQLSMAMVNAHLHADAQRTYLETISALAMAVEARDVYSRGHSDRVGVYSVRIAERMELGEQRIRTVREAAQLHDVGKIGISDDILRKPGKLDQYECEIIRQHPVIGEGIIMPLHGFSVLRDPIRHHHEWLNGEGYPDKLKGDQISLEARILTVADVYDALTTDRPYRKAMSWQEARQELVNYKGIRYDAEVVDVFVSLMEENADVRNNI